MTLQPLIFSLLILQLSFVNPPRMPRKVSSLTEIRFLESSNFGHIMYMVYHSGVSIRRVVETSPYLVARSSPQQTSRDAIRAKSLRLVADLES